VSLKPRSISGIPQQFVRIIRSSLIHKLEERPTILSLLQDDGTTINESIRLV
jgi:hypothetical protein